MIIDDESNSKMKDVRPEIIFEKLPVQLPGCNAQKLPGHRAPTS